MTATLSDAHTDTIAELDFTPACTCEAASICGHPEGTECGDAAAVIVTFHPANRCNGDHCDADGNEIGPMCQPCMDRVTPVLRAQISEIATMARMVGGVAACNTCGAPIMTLADVIRDIRPIQ